MFERLKYQYQWFKTAKAHVDKADEVVIPVRMNVEAFASSVGEFIELYSTGYTLKIRDDGTFDVGFRIHEEANPSVLDMKFMQAVLFSAYDLAEEIEALDPVEVNEDVLERTVIFRKTVAKARNEFLKDKRSLL